MFLALIGLLLSVGRFLDDHYGAEVSGSVRGRLNRAAAKLEDRDAGAGDRARLYRVGFPLICGWMLVPHALIALGLDPDSIVVFLTYLVTIPLLAVLSVLMVLALYDLGRVGVLHVIKKSADLKRIPSHTGMSVGHSHRLIALFRQ
jgi:hypothetical protein